MSTKKIKNISELFERAGGMVHVAAALNIGQNTIYSWIARNGIPVTHWPDLIEKYAVSPEELLNINKQIWANRRNKVGE